jgi:hypothetical protein
LQLSPEKTCVTHIEQGFDFLGQNLRKYGGKLLIQPSKKNTHNFLEKVRQLIRQNRGISQTDLIRQLNPIVRGWANYHRHVVAKGTFKKVEWVLWHSLWRWARRRHSGKRSRWLIQRYWHPLGGRNRFAADTRTRTPSGKPLWLKLVNPTEISIRRHVKIRGEANPFDARWRAYMEDRAFFKKFGIHRREAGLKPSSSPAPFMPMNPNKFFMNKIASTCWEIVVCALLTSVSAKAQVSIISENFNTSLSPGTSFTQYHGGDTTSYANGIVAGMGVGAPGVGRLYLTPQVVAPPVTPT